MPNSPGEVPVTMTIQAGQVMGGSQLRSRPQMPLSIKLESTGRRGRKRSKTKEGSAQSRPRTAILFFMAEQFRRKRGGFSWRGAGSCGLAHGGEGDVPFDPGGVTEISRGLSVIRDTPGLRAHLMTNAGGVSDD